MFELIGILRKRSIRDKDGKECNKSATWLKFQHRWMYIVVSRIEISLYLKLIDVSDWTVQSLNLPRLNQESLILVETNAYLTRPERR